MQKLAEVVTKMEQGELKLRVRALEAERGFKRVAVVQQMLGQAVGATCLLNLGTLLRLSSISGPGSAALAGSAVLALQVVVGVLKVKGLDKKEALIMGTA